MTLPVGSGYGGPFSYFIIQCVGVLVERKFPCGRVVTMLVILLPLPLLLHEGFRNLFTR